MEQIMRLVKSVGIGVIGLALASSAGAIAAGIVAVVSSKSSVTALSANQVADIFLGKANRFPDGSQAVPIDQAEGSAARDEFYAKLTGKSAAQMKAHWSKIIFTGRGQPPQEVSNSLEVKKLIVANPNVIGYIEENLVDGRVKVLLAQ
jgi:ABC-type phosphate transport system substrate-binding protein